VADECDQAGMADGSNSTGSEKGTLFSLFTRERAVVKNYRGISLLSTPGKVFATVLLNKVRDQLMAHHRVERSGFEPGRSMIDRIFTLNCIITSSKEFQKPLWIVFVDLKAAFDSADRMALRKLLRSLGLHSKVVDLTSCTDCTQTHVAVSTLMVWCPTGLQ